MTSLGRETMDAAHFFGTREIQKSKEVAEGDALGAAPQAQIEKEETEKHEERKPIAMNPALAVSIHNLPVQAVKFLNNVTSRNEVR